MASKYNDKNKLRCSFCGKSQDQVKKLIAGPDVFICDECIKCGLDIIKEDEKDFDLPEGGHLPKPIEIKKILDDYVIGRCKKGSFCSCIQPLQENCVSRCAKRC